MLPLDTETADLEEPVKIRSVGSRRVACHDERRRIIVLGSSVTVVDCVRTCGTAMPDAPNPARCSCAMKRRPEHYACALGWDAIRTNFDGARAAICHAIDLWFGTETPT